MLRYCLLGPVVIKSIVGEESIQNVNCVHWQRPESYLFPLSHVTHTYHLCVLHLHRIFTPLKTYPLSDQLFLCSHEKRWRRRQSGRSAQSTLRQKGKASSWETSFSERRNNLGEKIQKKKGAKQRPFPPSANKTRPRFLDGKRPEKRKTQNRKQEKKK